MRKSLNGYRVVHLTSNVPGPVGVSRLARAGARVTKVEGPAGDPLSRGAPDWYRELHQGQELVVLDLKAKGDLQKLEELLDTADLFVTSVRPSGLERLGLGWQQLSAKFPRLCMIQIQGYPAPRENEPAHDLTCQAKAGLLTPPQIPRALISDFAAAERVYSAALLLLLGMRAPGARGEREIVTLSESADEFMAAWNAGLTRPEGPLGGAWPGYQLYPAKTGWVAVGALEPHFWARFQERCKVESTSDEALQAVFATRTAEEWEHWGEENDVPFAAVR